MEGDPGEPRNAAGSRRLLVLGAGSAQLGLLEAARDTDVYVIAADRDPAAPGFALADRRAIVSTEDESGIAQLAEAESVHGIVSPGSDWPVGIAARVAARLGLPHPISPEAGVLATSKLKQRQRFAEAGVPQPRWKLVTGRPTTSSDSRSWSRRRIDRASAGSRSSARRTSSRRPSRRRSALREGSAA